MDFTEYCEFTGKTKEPLYQVEGEIPRCPPGYIYDRKKMDCVPKTKKDGVKGRLRDQDGGKKDSKPGNTQFNVWGRTGVNGDGYAWEDNSNIEGGSGDFDQSMIEPR